MHRALTTKQTNLADLLIKVVESKKQKGCLRCHLNHFGKVNKPIKLI